MSLQDRTCVLFTDFHSGGPYLEKMISIHVQNTEADTGGKLDHESPPVQPVKIIKIIFAIKIIFTRCTQVVIHDQVSVSGCENSTNRAYIKFFYFSSTLKSGMVTLCLTQYMIF